MLATAALGALLTVCSLTALRSLHYSSSLLLPFDGDPDGPPTSIGFDAGPYAQAPSLSPLRRFFAMHCDGLRGLDAAVCVSEVFALRFEHGGPESEFVDEGYDPEQALVTHAAGLPGHCVTRSGLAAAVLLSAGIPARVVQLVSVHPGAGHNVFSVHDDAHGWVVFDPSFGGYLSVDGRPVSASVARANQARLRFVQVGLQPHTAVDPVSFYERERKVFDGAIVYPEPWLFTRAGPRRSFFPFRGAYAYLPGGPFWVGPAQRLLQAAAVLSALTAILALFARVALALRPALFAIHPRLPRAPLSRGLRGDPAE